MTDIKAIAILIIVFGFAILVLLGDIVTNINHYTANRRIDTVLSIRKIDKQRDTDTVIIKHTNYK